MAPSTPQKPCTEIAPQGSSILVTLSLNRTPRQTTKPARIPMMNAEVGPTNAQGAVIATRPASIPLQAMVISGFPNFQYQNSMAVGEPEIAARLVVIAMSAMRRSGAPRVDPGLEPNQPRCRMKSP